MLIGRRPEIERIERLLESARAGQSAALVLRGDPGVGKTALLRHSVGEAEQMLVLRATGFESEAELEFSGLVEVCRPLLGSLGELPEVQSAALSSALGLIETTGTDRFAVAAATLSLLADATESGPVLVTVDDAHWLDRASLDALLFAARRLTVDPVAFLFATRPEGLLDAGLDEIVLEGLEPGAAARLVEESVGGRVDETVLHSLLEATAGNPLGLIELPAGLSAAQLAGTEPILEPVLASGAVERAFAGRLAALSEEARNLAVVVAASDGNNLALVRAALGDLGLSEGALRECEAAGILGVVSDRLSFAHPLLRAAAYQAAEPSFRRSAHQALAKAVGEADLERWAWHLALGAVAPDDEAADALSRAAAVAGSKHAHTAALAALERAAALTSDTDRRDSLELDAAEAAWAAGAPTRSLEGTERLLEGDLAPKVRMRALQISGRAEFQIGIAELALERLLEALELCGPDDPERAATIVYFACLALWVQGRIDEQIALARRGVELANGGPTRATTTASYMLGQALTMGGRSVEAEPWLQAAHDASLQPTEPGHVVDERRASFCLHLMCRSSEAEVVAERALERARKRGPLQTLWALVTLARVTFQIGSWERAEGLGSEAVALASALSQVGTTAEMELLLARIAGARGDEGTCAALVESSLSKTRRSGNLLGEVEARWSLGRAALGSDRLDAAIVELVAAVEGVTTMRMLDLDLAPEPDLVEALVRSGRSDEAEAALARWVDRGAGLATAWAPPLIATCRAALADESDLERAFEEALALHERAGDPYLAARARLLYGERLRRAGERVAARAQLRLAHAAFETLRCAAWAARASRELRTSGERLRSAAASGEELTPQEREIALQVAAGKQNKEVAAALFLSPKTVEFHLSRVYRKLDISTRSELVRLFAASS